MRGKTRIIALLLAGAIVGASQAQGVIARQHEMLVRAIRSGHAEGVVSGELAEQFRRQFRSDGVLLARAEVIGHYTRSDCKRLLVAYTKKDVMTEAGPRDLTLNVRLNYCLNGEPPPADLEPRP